MVQGASKCLLDLGWNLIDDDQSPITSNEVSLIDIEDGLESIRRVWWEYWALEIMMAVVTRIRWLMAHNASTMLYGAIPIRSGQCHNLRCYICRFMNESSLVLSYYLCKFTPLKTFDRTKSHRVQTREVDVMATDASSSSN